MYSAGELVVAISVYESIRERSRESGGVTRVECEPLLVVNYIHIFHTLENQQKSLLTLPSSLSDITSLHKVYTGL